MSNLHWDHHRVCPLFVVVKSGLSPLCFVFFWRSPKSTTSSPGKGPSSSVPTTAPVSSTGDEVTNHGHPVVVTVPTVIHLRLPLEVTCDHLRSAVWVCNCFSFSVKWIILLTTSSKVLLTLSWTLDDACNGSLLLL